MKRPKTKYKPAATNTSPKEANTGVQTCALPISQNTAKPHHSTEIGMMKASALTSRSPVRGRPDHNSRSPGLSSEETAFSPSPLIAPFPSDGITQRRRRSVKRWTVLRTHGPQERPPNSLFCFCFLNWRHGPPQVAGLCWRKRSRSPTFRRGPGRNHPIFVGAHARASRSGIATTEIAFLEILAAHCTSGRTARQRAARTATPQARPESPRKPRGTSNESPPRIKRRGIESDSVPLFALGRFAELAAAHAAILGVAW